MKRFIYGICLISLLGGVFLAGSWYNQQKSIHRGAGGQRNILYYVDPMHPAYKSDKPGTAPDCGMALEPVYEDGLDNSVVERVSELPEGTVAVSSDRQQLMGLRLGSAERVSASRTIRTIGRVVVDENRVYRVISSTEGWLRDLFGGTTGSLVKKDQILSSFYSRELAGAQQAYFFALNTLDRYNADNAADSQEEAARQQIRAAEANLTLIGMSEVQLEVLKRTRKPVREIELRSPITGFVLQRNVSPNLRFDRNTELYRIADLRRVWIVADLFEQDVRFYAPGVVARVSHPGLPGREFSAKVADVLPQADPTTRNLRVRLEIDNADYALRPDMFLDVELPVKLPAALTVPSDAVIDAGITKRVFVEHGGGVFEPRTVETGWRFGDRVQILKGLEEDERVVVSANFLVDSESRLRLSDAAPRAAKTVDPVCGMPVDPQNAGAIKTNYGDAVFYFCSDLCREKFAKHPVQFAALRKDRSRQ